MPLSLASVNKRVVNAQYAVRGAIALRAEELRNDLKSNPDKYPFKEIINANIGNPQQLDQEPITFYRQVLSLVQYPALLENPVQFAPDAVRRATHLLESIGSVGAYSTSNGVPAVRKSIANYISERDGFPADPENIFLSAGASAAVSKLLSLVTSDEKSSVLIPIPQYPLYSATLTLQGCHAVNYYLDENDAWSTKKTAIADAFNDARENGLTPKLIAVINPGNPTGSVLSPQNIRGICEFALENDLVILADEVYQKNVYEKEFTSFKKVRQQLVQEDKRFEQLQLASVHSTSKGTIGECGQRGGYLEIVGFSHDIKDLIYKMASIELCPVVSGQVLTELMVNPPKEGDESYEQYTQENNRIFETLKSRAHSLYGIFKQLEGVECNAPEGAMYLFPKFTLSEKAIESAKAKNMEADEFYCMELLENTGVCVVAGSGFGQEPGTFHFRTTFLAPGDEDFHKLFIDFHNGFMRKYK